MNVIDLHRLLRLFASGTRLQRRAGMSVAVVAVLSLFLAGGCAPVADAGQSSTVEESVAANLSEGTQQSELRLPAELVRAAEPRSLVLHGRVVALDERVLSFEQGGTLLEVLVERGDRVRSGDVLARLDDDALRIAQRSLNARSDELEARRLQLASDHERTRQLATQGAATTRQLEELDAALAGVEAGLRGVSAERDELNRRRRELVLRAPVDAEIMDVPMRAGAVVGAGTPVVLLRGEATREAEVAVPETWLSHFEPGMRSTVSFPVAGLPQAEGVIETLLEPAPGGSLSRARLRLANDSGARTGMRVEVSVLLPAASMEVPISALARTPTPSVWRVRDGLAEAVPVQVGRLGGAHAEISGELEPGDVLVTAGLDRLMNGREVTPLLREQAVEEGDR